MSVRVYVPGDMAAVAVGADQVATALTAAARAAGIDIHVVRNGSRGLFTLETLVEVETPQGRIGYGPVDAADVPGLVAAGLFAGGAHAQRLGPVEALPFFARQTRLTFARAGLTDPLSLTDYRAHGGLKGLETALALTPAEVVARVKASGLRGRGGAGFPTGIKWETVLAAPGPHKYIVCNADEGDSGTFADRLLMEADPFVLVEGMAIAAHAVGADYGYVYIRSEYPFAIARMQAAIDLARGDGWLGRGFDLEVRVGAGAYVCGEETALLESLEVLSLAAVPFILAEGANAYQDFGFGRSRGTMPIQLAGDVVNGGVFETPFGLTLGELVDDIAGGCVGGRPVRAVQVGGPLGAYFPRGLFDTPFDYEAFTARGGLIGHGGVVVFNDTVDLAQQARFAMEFCAAESCGKCTPCRIGSTRGVEVIDRIVAGEARAANIAVLEDLCETMKLGSLCALGGFTPYPVMSALDHFPEDFGGADARRAAE